MTPAQVLLNVLRAHGHMLTATPEGKLSVSPPLPAGDPVRDEVKALKDELLLLLDPEPPEDWTLPHNPPGAIVWEVDPETGELVDRTPPRPTIVVLAPNREPSRPELSLPPAGPVTVPAGRQLYYFTARGRACGPKGIGSGKARQPAVLWTWEGGPQWFPMDTHPPAIREVVEK